LTLSSKTLVGYHMHDRLWELAGARRTLAVRPFLSKIGRRHAEAEGGGGTMRGAP
jgi:hypothetical protein